MHTKLGNIYFYLGANGWVIDNQIVPKGYHRLHPNDDQSETQIVGVQNLMVLVSMRPITNYLRENGTSYEDYATLVTEVGSFFVSAPPTGGIEGTVDTYSELPPAANHTNQFWLVRNASGIYLINRKDAGLYISDGSTWIAAPDIIPYFSDLNFRVYNDQDNLKQIKFDVAAITSGQTRTITFPDYDIILGERSVNVPFVNDTLANEITIGSILTDKKFIIDIAVMRNSLGYSVDLILLWDGTTLFLKEGDYFPYIAASPRLGITFNKSIDVNDIKLLFDVSDGLGDGSLTYSLKII